MPDHEASTGVAAGRTFHYRDLLVENYLPTDSPVDGDYPNRIGSEDAPNNVMGVAAWLKEHIAEQAGQ